MVAQRSALRAFLIAAPAALGSWIVFLMAYVWLIEGQFRAATLLPYMIMGGVLFGLPLIAAALLLVAVPAWLALRFTIGITLYRAIAVGAACGVLAHFAVARTWGEPEVSFVPIPVAILAGAATAWLWWRVWRGAAAPELRGRDTI